MAKTQRSQVVRLDHGTLAALDKLAVGLGHLGGSRSAVFRVLVVGCRDGNEALKRLVDARADAAAQGGTS